MRPLGTLGFTLGALLITSSALAEAPAVSLGARLLLRGGDYAMAGAGGQLRLHPFRRVGVDLYADGLFGRWETVRRADVEVGSTIQYDVLRTESFALHPLLGACALVAFADDQDRSGTTANDIWFGVRAGLGVALQLGDKVTLQAQVQALLYLGHDFNSQRWILGSDDTLSVTPMGQGVLAINYGL
jgi:hypothetical protein